MKMLRQKNDVVNSVGESRESTPSENLSEVSDSVTNVVQPFPENMVGQWVTQEVWRIGDKSSSMPYIYNKQGAWWNEYQCRSYGVGMALEFTDPYAESSGSSNNQGWIYWQADPRVSSFFSFEMTLNPVGEHFTLTKSEYSGVVHCPIRGGRRPLIENREMTFVGRVSEDGNTMWLWESGADDVAISAILEKVSPSDAKFSAVTTGELPN